MTSLLGSSLSFLQVSAQHFFTQASSKPPLGRWELSYRNIPRKKTRANPTPADLITWSHPDLILFGTLLPHPQGARLLLIIISPPQEPPEAHPPSWSQAYETTKKKKTIAASCRRPHTFVRRIHTPYHLRRTGNWERCRFPTLLPN